MSGPWIAAFACLWLLVLLLGFTVVGVMRRMTGVLERTEHLLSQESDGVPPLTLIPPFEVVDEAGESLSSEHLLREPTIVLFMESGCKPCRALAAELADSRGAIGRVPLVVIAGDEGLGDGFGLSPDIPVLRQHGRDVAKLFKSLATPHAFVVDGAGVVLDRVIPGSVGDLEQMAERQQAGLRQLEEAARG
jgi:thiol-disulfide isomerase/thioredoxin